MSQLPACYRCKSQPCKCKDGITLYCADCRDVLLLLEPGIADVLVTDPPYGIVNQFGEQNRGKKGVRKLQFDWDSSEAVAEAVAKCSTPKAAVCFCGLDTVGVIQKVFRTASMTPKPMVWIKKCPPPPLPGNWWPSGFEIGVYAYETGAWFGDDDPKRHNVFYADSLCFGQPDKNGHPTQKPIGLMRRLVAGVCPPGRVVIDPFAGSGTTLRAAKDLGRKCIGIEIEEKYVQIAAARLEQGVLPFGEPEE